MAEITDAGRAAVGRIASRHGVAEATVLDLLHAVQRGHGTAAQFSIAELGGMGQWSRGGMTQVGDMFNDGLRAKVADMCQELAALLDDRTVFAEANTPQDHNPDGSDRPDHADHGDRAQWWPGDLGRPSSTGGQNDMAYAVFPDAHRLAVRQDGSVTVYDTGSYRISGFSQSQSSGAAQTLSFSTDSGTITTRDLTKLE